MNATQKLLNRVRSNTQTGSDYAVAKALGISAQRMSFYMQGRNELHDDDTIAKAAELIGENPAALMAEFHAERANSDKARFYWKKLAQLARDASPAAAAALLAICATMAPPSDAKNAGFDSGSDGSTAVQLCILW